MENLQHKKLFAVTSKDEEDYQFGTNVFDKEKFKQHKINPRQNGFTFTDIDNIVILFGFGHCLWEIQLSDSIVTKGDSGKWTTNIIDVKKKLMLDDPNTYEYLFSLGLNIPDSSNFILNMACKKGYLDVAEYCVGKGADVKNSNNRPLRVCAESGDVALAKFLVKNNVDLSIDNNYIMERAVKFGHLELVKYLVSQNITVTDDLFALAYDSKNLKLVDFLHSISMYKN